MEVKAGEGRTWARGHESKEAEWGQEGSLQEGAAFKQRPDERSDLHADLTGAQKARDLKQEGAQCVTDLREGKVT